jgi:hypothetical protein
MRVIIQGAVCNISEATAIAVLYPDYAWCDTLEQARKQQEQDQRIAKEFDAMMEQLYVEDYEVFRNIYKSIHGVNPHF